MFERLSVLCFLVLWLYLFFPFRPFGFPVMFGQIEEWTVSAVLLSVIGLLLFISSLRKQKFTLRLTVCDILLFLYLIYILFRLDEYLSVPDYYLALFALTMLYLIVRLLSVNQVRLILPTLIISFLFQVIYFFYRKGFAWSAVFAMDGIYNNTGIWGGFAGMVSVGIYGLLLFSRQNRIILSILFLFSSCLLVCSLSRAAWIGAFGGFVFLSFFFLRKKYGSRIWLPAIAILLLIVPVSIYGGKALYRLKPVSADGRYYIWKISSRMLSEHPLFGVGIDRFRSGYMYYQADYFSEHPESPFAQIADNITVPFNEPLKIAVEQGGIGLAVFLSIMFTALFPVHSKNPVKTDGGTEGDKSQAYYVYAAILITLLSFSFFSYPFIYIQFIFLLIACLAVLSRFQQGFRFSFRSNNSWRLSLIPFVFFSGCVLFGGIRYASYMEKLHHYNTRFGINKPENSLPFFASLESVLKSNPLFLGSYSNILSFNKDYVGAIEKLNASAAYQASYSNCMELGRNYEQSGDTEKALEYWGLASRMIPSHFEPLYLQIRNHHNNERYSQADSLTVLFLQKERKVDAITIDVMMRDVRRWERERKLIRD